MRVRFREGIMLVIFQSYEEGIEVNGTTVHAILDGLGPDRHRGYELLKIQQIDPFIPDAEHWYSQDRWLLVFKWITENLGHETLYHIGTTIPINAIVPVPIRTPEEALQAIDIAYHTNHRNARGEVLWVPERDPPMLEGIGHYHFEPHPHHPHAAIMECDNPYPCDFDMGLIYGFIWPFVERVTVSHLSDPGCRYDGKTSICRYLVEWEPKQTDQNVPQKLTMGT